MATAEPVQSPVENEEKPETKTTPVEEVKENGQDDNEPAADTAAPEEAEDEEEESEEEPTEVKSPETKTDEEEKEVEGQEDEGQEDEADKPGTKEQNEDGEKKEDGLEESSDDEPQVGSLDGPVKLMTGKRERKKVERLTMQSPSEKEKEKFEIKDGKGIKLGDCPIIEFNLQRTHSDVLKPLYRVLFYKTGKTTEIKKNIRKFSGFSFTKEDETEIQRKEKQLERFTTTGLKELCSILALERKGTKEDLCSRILNYLLEPVMITKKPPVKRKKGAKKSSKKKKVNAKGDAGKKRTSKSAEEVEDDDDDDEVDDDKADDDEDEEADEAEEKEEEEDDEEEESVPEEEVAEEDEDSEFEEPKKKKPRKGTPKSAKKTKAKTPKKSPTKKAAKKSKAPVDDSSDDEAPLAKKSNSPPSESEIKSVIIKFLDGANLEQVTMKTVCKMVYEKYPDFDLTPKKDFIKSTVKVIISS